MKSDVAAWMLVTFLLLTGVTAVGGLVWWLARGVWRLARAWRKRARPAAPVPERALTAWELGIPVDADMAWRLMVADGPDFYGSMTLAGKYGWLPAPEVARSGWWGQTVADLAPEALALEVMPSEPGDWPGLGHMSSGPGDLTSLAPGPDTARLAWLDRQLASHAEWARRMRGQVTGWGLEAAA